MGPNYSFSWKGDFWENWLTLLCSTHYATMSRKNTGRSCDIGWWSFGSNWTQITHLPLRGIFFKKLTDIFVYYRYPITILQCFKKKSLKWITKYKAAKFLDKLTRGIFWGENWVVTFVNLVCPIILKCLN